jgi:hypothetical protein
VEYSQDTLLPGLLLGPVRNNKLLNNCKLIRLALIFKFRSHLGINFVKIGLISLNYGMRSFLDTSTVYLTKLELYVE